MLSVKGIFVLVVNEESHHGEVCIVSDYRTIHELERMLKGAVNGFV